LRRHQRAPIDVPVEFVAKGSTERVAGRTRDVSVGGIFILTATPLPFGADLVLHVTMPGEKSPFALAGVVRWSKVGEGMGIQFGLMGARETHAITELTKEA
ncbi:MAG TPA: PilZ domain-containing protein, partial [Polyangiaceae bacterium]|nr:PilZ domain-containing protein [Polyangiaceae bacterium]